MLTSAIVFMVVDQFWNGWERMLVSKKVLLFGVYFNVIMLNQSLINRTATNKTRSSLSIIRRSKVM